MTWSCPKCKSTDLDVQIHTWARLFQEADGDFQTDVDEATDGSHQWDASSTMQCRSCGHTDASISFQNEVLVEVPEFELGDIIPF